VTVRPLMVSTLLLALGGAVSWPGADVPGPGHDSGAVTVAHADSVDYLRRLRAEQQLDLEIEGATTDLARVRALTRWAHGRFAHDGSHMPARPDPSSILAEARGGARFRCVEYADVLAGALSAVGIPARVVGLMTRDVETRTSGAGHVVVEAFLRDDEQWVMADAQWDVVPMRGDEPLDVIELARAIATGARDVTVASDAGTTTRTYVEWVTPYLFYALTRPSYWTTGIAPGDGATLYVPAGAPVPTTFQGRTPLPRAVVTRDLAAFYAPPPFVPIGRWMDAVWGLDATRPSWI
jgi:hypothetical protein